MSLSWLAWRFYKFYLLPRRHPEEPLAVPYSIPILGNAVPFLNNSYSFLVRARETVGRNGDPFSFTVLGTTFYVITQAKHASEVDKNTDTLSFEEFVQVFLRATGVSEAGIKACYGNKQPGMVVGIPNPLEGNIGDVTRRMHVNQLHPGQRQHELEARFLRSFDRQLRLPVIPGEASGADGVEVALFRWCADFFARAGEFAYFGDTLTRLDPEFADKFYIFDELSWQITYQIPDFIAREKAAAQKHLQRSLKKYFQTPQHDRDEHAWFTSTAEDAVREIGVSEDDIALLFLTIYLTISTNTRRTTFWVLTRLLYNPPLLEAVRQETAGAFEGDDLVNPAYLYSHDTCPQLEAVWLETLRVSSSGSSVRCIKKDTVIGGKLLRKGNNILIPSRLLHLDEGVYSQDALQFRPERFLEKSARARGGNWRPFGGGKTICTGRFVAEHMIKSCVSIVLRRFDMSVVGGARIPLGDECTPGLGIMGIRKGEDFKVRLSARKT
ncbi:putative cytochrome p450 [Thozetella sp. PMI_491]|nr:putative cytochrome p450 [Thozetella sp. PMI_491]